MTKSATTKPDIDLHKLRVELVRLGLSQISLARLLAVPPTSLGGWLRGVHPAPKGLLEQIAVALGIPKDKLSSDRKHGGFKRRALRTGGPS